MNINVWNSIYVVVYIPEICSRTTYMLMLLRSGEILAGVYSFKYRPAGGGGGEDQTSTNVLSILRIFYKKNHKHLTKNLKN